MARSLRVLVSTIVFRGLLGGCVGAETGVAVAPTWAGTTVRDLHKEYPKIFLKGNRNAASHLWSSFLLDRAAGMPAATLELMFSGFCAISGSPVRPSDYTRYAMRLDTVTGRSLHGYTYFCCWPCVCDSSDWVKVDTRTVITADGPKAYHFLVIGDPCNHPEKIPDEAPEVTCDADGRVEGATLSDHGYVILTLFPLQSEAEAPAQQQADFGDECEGRKQSGYNSGMGEIFRKVAGIFPLRTRTLSGKICSIETCAANEGVNRLEITEQ